MGPKCLVTRSSARCGLEVADDHDRRVVRSVVRAVVLAEGFPRHLLDVAPPPDDRPVIGMRLDRRRGHRLAQERVGIVLAALQLAPHHRHLGVEVGLVDPAVEHPVGLELDGELEAVGRQRLEVAGPVVERVGVEAGPVQEERAGDLAQAIPLGPLEHHVLEEVRDAGDAVVLVSRADLVPDAEAHHGRAPDLLRQHAEPVGQAGLPDPGGQRRVRRPGRRLAVDEPHAGNGQEEPEEDGKGAAASREPRAIH